MINGKTVLAVIPARGGSKRCPRKNLRDYNGQPLIQWAFESAAQSKYIDRVVCSTEDSEIKELAMQFGDVIDRPAELATDTASAEDVLRHALELLPHDYIVLLQPTSPLRSGEDINMAIEAAQQAVCGITGRQNNSKNGAVYVTTAQYLQSGGNFSSHQPNVEMPDARSLDIDFPHQFDE